MFEKNNCQQKNGKVELVRFLSAIVVILVHSHTAMKYEERILFPSGELILGFFLQVTGFLMAMTIQRTIAARNAAGERVSVGKETEKFMWKKFSGLFPAMGIIFVMFIISNAIEFDYNLWKYILKFAKALPSAFVIHQTGITIDVIPGTWYLSSMLFALILIVPLYYKFPRFMKTIGCLIISFLIMGWMLQTIGSVSNPRHFNGVTYVGNLIAISQIALGAVVYSAAEVLRRIDFKPFARVLLLIVEVGGYLFYFLYMAFHELSYWDYIVLLVTAVSLTISFSNAGALPHILDNKVCYFLGRASLFMYLGHLAVYRNIDAFIPKSMKKTNESRLLFFLLVCAGAIVFLWVMTILCRKAWPHIKKLLVNTKKDVTEDTTEVGK